MTTQKQIDANKQNSARSTGPKTAEGKARTRYNALSHGCRARTLVLMPNEDPVEYAAQVDHWIDDHQPANAAEEQLIRECADLSWLIDRAKWNEGQLLYQQVADAMAQAERDRVDRDQAALLQLVPTVEEAIAARRSYSVGAKQLRTIVETTADGCNHLLSVWRDLRATALDQQPWNEVQELHAVRLLGFGYEIICNTALLDLVVANRFTRDPKINKHSWKDRSCGMAFGWTEIDEALERKPAGLAEAFALMLKTADQAIARLVDILADRQRDGDLETLKVINPVTTHVIVDPSVDVEKMRKYRSSLSAELLRTLDALAKLRREQARWRKEMGICANKANLVEAAGANEANSRMDADRDVEVPGPERDHASAPNEAILGEASAVEKGDRHAGYGEPVAVSAPNEANFGEAAAPNEAKLTRRQRRHMQKQALEMERQARRSQFGK